MKVLNSLLILLIISLGVVQAIIIDIGPDVGNGLHSSLHYKQTRKNGMPTQMWPVQKELMGLLSVGKIVYLMPKEQDYAAQPLEVVIMAIYQGMEVGYDNKVIPVGAVILNKDFNNYGSFSHHQQSSFFTTDTLSTNSIDLVYQLPSVSCSFDALTNPNKIYVNKREVYIKLLAIYEKSIQDNTSERDTYQTQMDENKIAIQAGIDRIKKALN